MDHKIVALIMGFSSFCVIVPASPARAADCDFGGKFRSLVMSTIGEQRALDTTSFKIAVIRPDNGDTLCEDLSCPGSFDSKCVRI